MAILPIQSVRAVMMARNQSSDWERVLVKRRVVPADSIFGGLAGGDGGRDGRPRESARFWGENAVEKDGFVVGGVDDLADFAPAWPRSVEAASWRLDMVAESPQVRRAG